MVQTKIDLDDTLKDDEKVKNAQLDESALAIREEIIKKLPLENNILKGKIVSKY